ncbi:MAG: ATP-binding cassette domain-containing protein [Microcoleus sp. PH2017_29_MFU_D_A]|uniref:nitrate ABC transporter ATP-binding protein n=1 Tax=unclassified Microcoleus TaxID=2642155 RepID=UPI001DF5257A|nr:MULTISPECIES: nitrate ABC transporter ATP-binding protein [unclassified Microcoleus]MCC3421017.1 ATP-binding cassette domain-containing protein [Microcoleus sp. PH2017_07_MST_O_A]MCC3415160.1 ATP-binding cassette domain-containing protein [Microcoleus sp. PH2017_02_FOX_O_A]MCC3457283.1 ATP-binding cassette domain-containing protein [Microcoleus sp. PH2017_08_TRC_O_A]MCC3494311.1 ATP-binding cassette domain-containing protein [Microcoleus sp. PH2017_16_JOR_D_A]MCC3498982.1 ATP-binding casset
MSNSANPQPNPENMQTIKAPPATKIQSKKSGFLTIKDVSKVYPNLKEPEKPFVILDGVNLTINEGEFICLIGHSGCGKSTLLNMIAGFNGPTSGEVALEGARITEPGPDRMVVFQNYSLLPWLTATENIHLGVETVYGDKSAEEHDKIVKDNLELVGLTEACNKRPGQLSGGMKQRVAIARALATRPKLLILDEPFGALDPITREELQEELLKIWHEYKITIVMITHDIDEALFLADRIVMMTNGPAASIGEDMHIPFSRPRNRTRMMEDPKYYELRNFALEFLFSRYAHHEEDTTDSEMAPVVLPLPASKKPGATADKPMPPVSFVPHAAQPLEASPIKGAVLAISWLVTMATLAAVNTSAVSSQLKQAKLAETAPPAPAAVVSSPPSPAPIAASPAPIAASPAPIAASPAPIAASPAPIAASPAPSAAASPASIASPAPSAAASPASIASPATSPTKAASSAGSGISDKAELDAIGNQLYARIDENWKTTPTFTQSLTYRVKVKQNGDIVQFEPTNKAAKDFLKETPLPTLQTPAGAAAGAQKTADFQVTFSPTSGGGGLLEVKTAK